MIQVKTKEELKKAVETRIQGAFRISSYEWGITYQALLAAAQVTGEEKYSDYVRKCFDFIAEMAPHFREQEKCEDAQMEQILHPRALDDCGTMCIFKIMFGQNDMRLSAYRTAH